MQYWIRLATSDDIIQMVQIEKEAFPPNKLETPWGDVDFKFYIDHPYTFVLVAETNKEIIGKAVGKIYKGKTNRSLQILDLAVTQKYSGMGIGSALLEYLEHLGKHLGCAYAAVNVLSKSTPAVNMYKKFGYKLISGYTMNLRLTRMKKEFMER